MFSKEFHRRRLGLTIVGILAIGILLCLIWNFWFNGTLSGDKDDGLPFYVSQKSAIFDFDSGGYVSLTPKKPLKSDAEVHILHDSPGVIDTLGSFKVEAHSTRPIFIPLHSHTKAGRAVLSFKSKSHQFENLFKLKISVQVVHSVLFGYFSIFLGWAYFLAWSCSYYPQIYYNWKRRSVVGYSFDYLALNVTGHLCYCFFNTAMFYSTYIQKEYSKLHPRGELPVKSNDAMFSINAVSMNVVIIIQCLTLERGDQKVAMVIIAMVGGMWLSIFSGLAAAFMHRLSWLQYLYYLSYIKVATSPTKYTPQVFLNYKRKSTDGWSVHVIFLDMLGGSLSFAQMIMEAINNDDLEGTFGNPCKLGLSIVTMAYNVVFLVQHFILYPKSSYNRKRLTSGSTNSDFVVKYDALKASINPYKSESVLHRVQDL